MHSSCFFFKKNICVVLAQSTAGQNTQEKEPVHQTKDKENAEPSVGTNAFDFPAIQHFVSHTKTTTTTTTTTKTTTRTLRGASANSAGAAFAGAAAGAAGAALSALNAIGNASRENVVQFARCDVDR